MAQTVQASPANRRKSPRRRARTSLKVECRKGSLGLGINIASTVLDVSDRGVRLIIKQALDMTGDVEVTITSYGIRKPLRRLGNVRWQLKLDDGSFCAGIEFQKQIAYRDWQLLASPS